MDSDIMLQCPPLTRCLTRAPVKICPPPPPPGPNPVTTPGPQCCYERSFWDDRSVVESFPASCMQLLCIMQNIVPYSPFDECSRNCCLSKDNELKANWETWYEGCFLLQCVNGIPKEIDVHPSCCPYGPSYVPLGSMFINICSQILCQNGEWTPTGYISNNCSKCEIYNDPHFNNFRGNVFDFHGTCNYSVSQGDTSYDPEFGIFASFVRCGRRASCLHITTYRDNENTIIKIGTNGLSSNLVKIDINGDDFEVPSTGAKFVTSSGGITHPVLVWRVGRCIRLQGAHYLISHCSDSMSIWYHESEESQLFGLCGAAPGDESGGFVSRPPSRPGTINSWGNSWKTDVQSSSSCQSTTRHRRELEMDDCREEDTTTFRRQCQDVLTPIVAGTENRFNETLNERIEACTTDMCQFHLNGEDQPEWLNTAAFMLETYKSEQDSIKDIDKCPPGNGTSTVTSTTITSTMTSIESTPTTTTPPVTTITTPPSSTTTTSPDPTTTPSVPTTKTPPVPTTTTPPDPTTTTPPDPTTTTPPDPTTTTPPDPTTTTPPDPTTTTPPDPNTTVAPDQTTTTPPDPTTTTPPDPTTTTPPDPTTTTPHDTNTTTPHDTNTTIPLDATTTPPPVPTTTAPPGSTTSTPPGTTTTPTRPAKTTHRGTTIKVPPNPTKNTPGSPRKTTILNPATSTRDIVTANRTTT